MEVLYQALEWIMNGCYAICHNYGIAIILFTLISKIILLPVSIWVQKNSIKMVKKLTYINNLTRNVKLLLILTTLWASSRNVTGWQSILEIKIRLQKNRQKSTNVKNIIRWHL